jgi:hypothetical protein
MGSDAMEILVARPLVDTRVFVPGGGSGGGGDGRDRRCCKPLEPSPVSWGARTVVAGPVARGVHIGDASSVDSLSLCLSTIPWLNRRRALRQTDSPTKHPRKLPRSQSPTSLQPPQTS